MIGSRLVPELVAAGHRLRILSRRSGPSTPDIRSYVWDPEAGRIEDEALAGVDAVVHLAGESVAGGRWTTKRKEAIRRSRVLGTSLLAQRLAALSAPRPKVLVSASAIGVWGDRGDELLDDDSPPGEGFLSEVAVEWEAAAEPARQAGIRVVHPRIGVVLSRAGGALKTMLLPFQLGIGGVFGPGTQWMSWILLDDLVSVFRVLLERAHLAGPIAAVAPNAVTNREFTKTLGRVLHRPTIFPVPSFGARLAFGEMADGLLLASARVQPRRLVESGFDYEEPSLEGALRAALAHSPRST